MKKFVPKLDGETVRREFPIVDLVEGWFFRCRKVSVEGYRVEGTDIWGSRVWKEGIDPDKLLAECAECAAKMGHHIKEIVFEEYGTQLQLNGEELILSVLCGGVGQFGVEIVLNEFERERYKHEGDSFVKELANTVRQSPNTYKNRARYS
jgi:hypothetical protein